MLRSRKCWEDWSREFWKVGIGNFGKIGVGYFTSYSTTLLPTSDVVALVAQKSGQASIFAIHKSPNWLWDLLPVANKLRIYLISGIAFFCRAKNSVKIRQTPSARNINAPRSKALGLKPHHKVGCGRFCRRSWLDRTGFVQWTVNAVLDLLATDAVFVLLLIQRERESKLQLFLLFQSSFVSFRRFLWPTSLSCGANVKHPANYTVNIFLFSLQF